MDDSTPDPDWRVAVAKLFEQYGPELHRRALVLLAGNEADALDLVQQTFVNALEASPAAPIKNPRAWLHRVMGNLHTDSCRRRSGRRSVTADEVLSEVEDPRSQEPYESIVFTETIAGSLEQIRCGVWCLGPEYQDVLSSWLDTYHLNGVAQGEVLGEMFGLTQRQVASLVQRAIRALRDRIGDHPGGPGPRARNDPWVRLSQVGDVAVIRELQRELDGSESRLSVTRNCVDHLLPEQWHVHLEYRWLDAIQQRGKVNRPTLWQQQQQSRAGSDYVIRVLSPASALRYAARNERGWLDEFSDRLCANRDNSAVAFLDDADWQRIDAGVSRLVGDRCWMKISVRDLSLACVFTYPRVYYTRDRQTIDHLVRLVVGRDPDARRWCFPWGRKTRAMLDGSYHLASEVIDDFRHTTR